MFMGIMLILSLRLASKIIMAVFSASLKNWKKKFTARNLQNVAALRQLTICNLINQYLACQSKLQFGMSCIQNWLL
jgi:hypothetical protein